MSMTSMRPRGSRRGLVAGAFAACTMLLAGSASAQTASAPPPSATAAEAKAPSEIMAVNLIRLLVKQGVITQAAADALMQQAEAETQQAQAQQQTQLASAAPPPGPGVIRVPYVPEVVRNQIRDDIKKDVLAEAKTEGWASPHAIPSWVDRIQFFGDLRFQDQFNFYSNSNVTPYIDYATLNNNGPIDVNADTNPKGLPYLNTRADRLDQLIIRGRFGAKFQVTDGVAFTVRLATGADNGPDSTTQLLTNDLTKDNIWLDQAFITLTQVDWASLDLGRAPNRFMHTDLVFSENLNLDGVQATVERPVGSKGLKLFGAAGIVPLGYVSSSFPTNSGPKAPDSTKWLFAAQAGAKIQPDERSWSASGAVSYYDFDNVKGSLSAPCDLSSGVKQCSSDSSRPAYMQKGNTLFLIRDILPDPGNPIYAQPQFAGLSYNYRLIDAVARFQTPLFGNIHGELVGDYVRNLAYDPSVALANPLAQPVTNFNVPPSGGPGFYRSGPNAFLVKGTIGYLNPQNRGDWFFTLGYKYIEPDAVLDAFNDYDFHLGGTNAKGYFVTAGYYFAKNSWVDTRFYSANEVFGAPLSIDVLMLELNTRF